MLCGGLSYRSFLVALLCTFVLALPARAAFEIVAHDCFGDEVTRQTTFTITFNQPPDFFTTNELAQPANAFQYFYDAEPTDDEIGFAGEDVVIVRGAEVRVDNNIPIRDSLNETGEEFPNAEGWGEVLGTADFQLDGATISFTTSWDILGESDGVFGYRLFALEQAELTAEVTFLSRILVPLPPPLLGGAALLMLALKTKKI